ncbi:MAG: hypothetical protein NC925_04240, partial [Candidatus Omnitrophica bacterium]|nr:hypothetical protein [Candidatus Omnitrophota bacterium]
MIESYILREKEKQSRTSYIGMSQLGFCPLLNYYLYSRGEGKKFSANVQERMEIGKFLHEKVITFFVTNYKDRYISGDLDESLQLSLKTFKDNIVKGRFDLYD